MTDFKPAGIYKRITGMLLLIIFSGHFASVTFFTHTHTIDGATIVHSHPFKNPAGKNPSGHNHTKNGILFTHFVSDILTIVPAVLAGITVLRSFVRISRIIFECFSYPSAILYYACLPRAPTLW